MRQMGLTNSRFDGCLTGLFCSRIRTSISTCGAGTRHSTGRSGGIYRSLNSSSYLRDEQVCFANFCIGKGNDICQSDVQAPTPKIATFRAPGSNLVFTGSNGVPGATYFLVASTNLALPLAQWQSIASNVFDSHGEFNITNSLASAFSQQFFRIRTQ